MIEFFQNVFVGFRLVDALDILIVAYLIYKLLGFIQQTRAQQLVRGLVFLAVIFFLSDVLNLYLLNWLLRNFMTMGLFALIVIFQPELRRALEQLGRKNLVTGQFRSLDKEHALQVVDEIVTAVDDFSATRTGALIVFERETALNDIIESGAVVDAQISVRLLGNLFYEGSPLHDGAVIIRGDRIYAASCVLPLTEKKNIGRNLGTRHRAALGVSEVSDALVIVVSEETGVISIAENGTFRRFMDLESVEKILLGVYLPPDESLSKRVVRTLHPMKHRRKEARHHDEK